MRRCPPEDSLARLIGNTLAPVEFEPLEAHVEACAACQAALDRLTAFADTAWLTPPPAGRSQSPAAPVIPGCEVYEPIGRGGHGVVYRGRQTDLDRPVAVKVLRGGTFATPGERERFASEARAVARLKHPHIAQVYSVGEAGGVPYLLLELVTGGDLAGRLAESPLTPRDAAAVVEAVARAVQHAHEAGVVHRDLKPANVLLDGGTLARPVVTDFGLAKLVGAEAGPTLTLDALGTPSYMAPEVAAGGARAGGPAADVYALGAILYECLTGRPPFRGASPFDTLRMVREADPVPPCLLVPSVPRDLETVCLACLRKEPVARPPSAAAVADDLGRVLAGRPVLTRPPSPVARAVHWVRRHPRAAGWAAVVVVVVAGFAALTAHARGQLREAEARERAAAIAAANVSRVETLVAGLGDARPLARPHLHRLLAAAPPDSSERVNLLIALLPDDPSLADDLFRRAPAAGVEELFAIREALRPHAGRLAPALWDRLAAPASSGEFVRSAVLLADWSPDDARWPAVAPAVARRLVAENPLLLGRWADGLRSVRSSLTPHLVAVGRSAESPPGQRAAAAALLADLAADRPETLTDLLPHTTPEQFHLLVAALRADEPTRSRLRSLAGEPRPVTAADAVLDARAERVARAAVALSRLGDPSAVWALLALDGADRRDRTAVVHLLAPLGVTRDALAARLARVPTAAERRGLLHALGGYPPPEPGEAAGEDLRGSVLALYRDDPDAGVHAAAGWLLRERLGVTDPDADVKSGATGVPSGVRNWSVSATDVPLVRFESTAAFAGGIADRPGVKQNVEPEYTGRVRRAFALAAREVTVREFRAFLEAHPKVKEQYTPPNNFDQELDEPIVSVTWYQAAQFCRWLSEREGVAEEDMCYPPVDQIKPGLKLAPGFLARTGYRLPTELEWEYACRGGTRTLREYGSSPGQLGHYAWHLGTRDIQPGPVARKLPTDAGLFDVYGNAWEWTQPVRTTAPDGVREAWADDPRPTVHGEMTEYHPVARGGSYLYHEPQIYSARRYPILPGKADWTVGFRVARTLPPPR